MCDVVGIIGNSISTVIFLLPAPTFYSIWKNKDIDEDFEIYPHLLKMLICFLWVFYGLPIVKPDRLVIIPCNTFGLVVELIYIAIFFFYDRQNYERRLFDAFCLFGEVMLMVSTVTFALLSHDHQRILLAGIACIIINVVMSSSHLLTMKKVIDSQNVELMQFYVSLANLANACIWTAYALVANDHVIFFSYGIEALYCLAQLVVYACFYKPENDLVKLSKIHPYPG